MKEEGSRREQEKRKNKIMGVAGNTGLGSISNLSITKHLFSAGENSITKLEKSQNASGIQSNLGKLDNSGYTIPTLKIYNRL
jgi:hypothetical protein